MLTGEWKSVIDGWTACLRAGGAPETTVATRREHIERAARATTWRRPRDVSDDELLKFFAAQSWAVETRRSHRASHRRFWAWAHANGYTDRDPAQVLPKVKASEPLPRPCPEQVLLQAKAKASRRTVLILRCAAEAGMRRTEIARVHRDDLFEDLAGWSLLVHGKGGRNRLVPLNAGLAAAIIAATEESGGYMLPGREPNTHLSPRYVGTLATRMLDGDWTLHTLRHYFATRAYRLDRDVFTVQQLLGHASPATTQRYVGQDLDALRRTVDAVAA